MINNVAFLLLFIIIAVVVVQRWHELATWRTPPNLLRLHRVSPLSLSLWWQSHLLCAASAPFSCLNTLAHAPPNDGAGTQSVSWPVNVQHQLQPRLESDDDACRLCRAYFVYTLTLECIANSSSNHRQNNAFLTHSLPVPAHWNPFWHLAHFVYVIVLLPLHLLSLPLCLLV